MDFEVGDDVKFEIGDHYGEPRWDYGCDNGSTGNWAYGKVTSASEKSITVEYYNEYEGESYTWTFPVDAKSLKRPGMVRLSGRKKKKPYEPKGNEVFYVEVDQNIGAGKHGVPKGFVSRACRNQHDDFITVRLLDINPKPDKGYRGARETSWLEVNKISKSSYYRRRKDNKKFSWQKKKKASK